MTSTTETVTYIYAGSSPRHTRVTDVHMWFNFVSGYDFIHPKKLYAFSSMTVRR